MSNDFNATIITEYFAVTILMVIATDMPTARLIARTLIFGKVSALMRSMQTHGLVRSTPKKP